MTELLLVAGGIIAIGLMFVFAIKPTLALLVFYCVLPLVSYASISTVKIPGSSATIALGGITSIFILLVGVLYVFFRGKNVLRWPGSTWFLCFLIISGLTVFASHDTFEGLKYWIRLLSLFILYLLTVSIFNTEKDASRFTTALLVSLVVPMAAGFYQFLSGTGMQDVMGIYKVPYGPRRIFGVFHIPNVYAAYLALPTFLTAILALEKGIPQRKRIICGLLTGASALSLFLTYTRSAWIGVFLGFLYVGFKRYKKIVAMLFIVAAIVFAVFSAEQLRLGEIQKGQVTGGGRLNLWRAMWPTALAKPILGNGLANTPRLVKRTTGVPNGGQSEYYKVLLESGFLGLFALLCTFALMFRGLVKALEFCRGNKVCEPLILSITAYFIASIFIAGFENFTLLENFFLIPVGVGIGVGYGVSNSNEHMLRKASNS